MTSDAGTLSRSALARVADLRAKLGTGRGRTLMLLVAGTAFAVILWVSVANLPPIEGGLRVAPLVMLALVGYPAMVACMAAQYRLSARYVERRVTTLDATAVAILSAAANLLPIPGSLLMRSEGLNQRGVRYGRALRSSTLIGLGWLTATALFVVALSLATDPAVAAAAGVLSLGGLAACVKLSGFVEPQARAGVIASALAIGAVVAVVAAVNQWLVLEALRAEVSPSAAAVVSANGVLAAAVGFFPGGLGLREAFGAGLAAAVGVPAAVGAVAVSLTRVIAMAVLLVLTIATTLLGRHGTAAPDHGTSPMGGAP